MPTYFDDNFGHYNDTDDPDVVEWYHENQRRSRLKKCKRCGRKVRLLPEYAICNGCAERIERGEDW
jgi:uncharacterized OB-fold protein